MVLSVQEVVRGMSLPPGYNQEALEQLANMADAYECEIARLRTALETLSNELAPWLVDCNGLPGVIKTLGESTAIHTAQRKALAALGSLKEADHD